MSRTRSHFIDAIRHVIKKPQTKNEQIAIVHSLVLLAATTANAMSSNSVDFSSANVMESAEEMIQVLEKTFDVELLSE